MMTCRRMLRALQRVVLFLTSGIESLFTSHSVGGGLLSSCMFTAMLSMRRRFLLLVRNIEALYLTHDVKYGPLLSHNRGIAVVASAGQRFLFLAREAKTLYLIHEVKSGHLSDLPGHRTAVRIL